MRNTVGLIVTALLAVTVHNVKLMGSDGCMSGIDQTLSEFSTCCQECDQLNEEEAELAYIAAIAASEDNAQVTATDNQTDDTSCCTENCKDSIIGNICSLKADM